MSKQAGTMRVTARQIFARKGAEKIVGLTAYTAPLAALLDSHVDFLLVGDSVGMVVHGYPNTTSVTLDMMVLHGQAVMRGSAHALVVVDLPFGSYESDPPTAYRAAVRVMQETGCQAVKIEACAGAAEIVSFLVGRGIPVMGHVGLRPQAAHIDGGFKTKGRTEAERQRVLDEAKAMDRSGAFAIVVEGVTASLADEITAAVKAPTIGIGASANCDGQILVTDDMLGLFEWTPKFVRRYGDLRGLITRAASDYAADVRSGQFPSRSETYAFGSGA